MLLGPAIAVGASSFAPLAVVSIRNPGAENGSTVAWNVTNGFTVGQDNPATGNWHFKGGPNSPSSASQTLNIPSSLYDSVDSIDTVAVVTWQQGHGGNSSTGTILVESLDAVDSLLGSQELVETAPTTYTERSVSHALPSGTRKIRITMKATKVGGGDNDAYFDDVSIQLNGITYTEQAQYIDQMYKASPTGSNNQIITSYSSTSNGTDFNTTNGRWTCPTSGYYLVSFTGYNNSTVSGTTHIALYKNGVEQDRWHDNGDVSEGRSFHRPGLWIDYYESGDYLELYQGGTSTSAVFGQIYWNVMGLHVSYLFRSSKAAASGVVPGDISSYDSIDVEWNTNGFDGFDISTGIFTAPKDGNYVFAWKTKFTDGISNNFQQVRILKDTTLIALISNISTGLGNDGFDYPASGLVVMSCTEGQEVKLRQEAGSTADEVLFMGFMLHPSAHAFQARRAANFTMPATANTVDTIDGYDVLQLDTLSGFNLTNGRYTTQAGRNTNLWYLFGNMDVGGSLNFNPRTYSRLVRSSDGASLAQSTRYHDQNGRHTTFIGQRTAFSDGTHFELRATAAGSALVHETIFGAFEAYGNDL